MGMMLETTVDAGCSRDQGGPHFGSPDKDPAVRLRVLEDAGRVDVPFTTGILIGIGETLAERAESLFAIRRVAREYGGIQEVIVQNFRAKPDTAMRGMPDAELRRPRRHGRGRPAGARARGADPGAAEPGRRPSTRCCCAAGIDDWGGVSPLTPDHVNPERPWPQIDELAARTAAAGLHAARAADRLPELPRASRGSTRGCAAHVRGAGRPGTGLAAEARMPRGLPGRSRTAAGATPRGRTDLHTDDRHRRAAPTTGAATSTRSTATGTRSPARRIAAGPAPAARRRRPRPGRRLPAPRSRRRCARPSATRPG